VKITKMSGKERPSMLKVGIGYSDGWKQELQHWFCWPDALKKLNTVNIYYTNG